MADLGKVPTLSDLGITSSDIINGWNALPPATRNTVAVCFNTLPRELFQNNDILLLLMQHPYYVVGLTRLLSRCYELNLPYQDYLQEIGSQAFIAAKMDAIFCRLKEFGFTINEVRFKALLSIQDADSFYHVLSLLHNQGLLNETRLNMMLKYSNYPPKAYNDCLTLLLKHFLLTDANEDRLLHVQAENLSEVSNCLLILDYAHCLTQKLLEMIIDKQAYARSITDGLEKLYSRVNRFTPEQASTVIMAENMAKAIAGCLWFLIHSDLDTKANCDSLIRMKDYAGAIEIVLYQLSCNRAVNQENLNHTLELASFLTLPTVEEKLKNIPWSDPLSMKEINDLFSQLDELSKLAKKDPEDPESNCPAKRI